MSAYLHDKTALELELSGASGQRGSPGTSAVIHVFKRTFFKKKSCIPCFPGADKRPNTGTWEPEESLLVFNPTISATHTHRPMRP